MKKPEKIILSIVIFLFASSSSAYIYQSEFLSLGQSYLGKLASLKTDGLDQQSGDKKSFCISRYEPIFNDGVIDIRIVMGYFDWTTGSIVRKKGTNYGYSPSLDLGAFAALKKLLIGKCSGNARFCGFSNDSSAPYRFIKKVVVQGKPYQVKLDMYFPSVSEYLNANTGKYLKNQKQRSAAAQAQFHSALQHADAVFYLGHSRNGGGPDFDPPIFVSGKNKVNYSGYYKPKRPGLSKMLTALQSGPRQPSILGIMSCDSRDHFLPTIRKAVPKMGIISSLNVAKVDGVFTALIGGVDAILRGQCQTGFARSLRLTSFNQRNITMDGMFE